MYVIEKGIPVMESGGGRPKLYPLRDMKVGDSFCVDVCKRSSVASVASALKPKRFATRIVDENGKKVCRVWRVK